MQHWLDVLSVCVDDVDDLHTTLVWGDRLNSFGVMWYHLSLGWIQLYMGTSLPLLELLGKKRDDEGSEIVIFLAMRGKGRGENPIESVT